MVVLSEISLPLYLVLVLLLKTGVLLLPILLLFPAVAFYRLRLNLDFRLCHLLACCTILMHRLATELGQGSLWLSFRLEAAASVPLVIG